MNTRSIGDFGKHLSAVVLEREYGNWRGSVVSVASQSSTHHLEIQKPISNSVFTKPAAILVCTRGKWSNLMPPERPKLQELVKQYEEQGVEFWLSFVHYQYDDAGLSFTIHMLPGRKLNQDSDFRRVKRQKFVEQIVTARLRAKAALRFRSTMGEWNHE